MLKPLKYTTKTHKLYKIEGQNPQHIQLKPLKYKKKVMLWLKPITYTNLKKMILVHFVKTIKMDKFAKQNGALLYV